MKVVAASITMNADKWPLGARVERTGCSESSVLQTGAVLHGASRPAPEAGSDCLTLLSGWRASLDARRGSRQASRHVNLGEGKGREGESATVAC